jgi:hypothetical protein
MGSKQIAGYFQTLIIHSCGVKPQPHPAIFLRDSQSVDLAQRFRIVRNILSTLIREKHLWHDELMVGWCPPRVVPLVGS